MSSIKLPAWWFPYDGLGYGLNLHSPVKVYVDPHQVIAGHYVPVTTAEGDKGLAKYEELYGSYVVA